jgi:hypothetical protein
VSWQINISGHSEKQDRKRVLKAAKTALEALDADDGISYVTIMPPAEPGGITIQQLSYSRAEALAKLKEASDG